MNILIFANGELRNIPVHWSEICPTENVFVISDEKPNYAHSDFKHFRKCTFAQFDDFDRYSELKIDPGLLESLSVCESQALKMMERYEFYMGLFSYNARIDLYHRQLQYWYNYLQANKIELVVFSVTPHVIFDFIIYCICKHLNIRTLMLYRITIVLNKNVSIYAFEDIVRQIPSIEKRYLYHFNNPEAAELSDRIASYYSFRAPSPGQTFTGVHNRKFKKYINPLVYIRFIKFRFLGLMEWMSYLTWGDVAARVVAMCVRSKKLRFKTVAKPDLECKYIYVALHYQPECSTSPMGGHFVYQDLMVSFLVTATPKDWIIYIKGHLKDGLNPTFAKRMIFDERTILIDESFPSIQLIQHAQAVATVTGTAGFEAFMNKVPVLMFGNYFYQHAPGVFKIATIQDLVSAIDLIVTGAVVISEEKILAFLKALDENTIEGWVDNRYQNMCRLSQKENCYRIASLIESALKESSV